MKKLIIAFLLFAFVHVSFASPPLVDSKQKIEKLATEKAVIAVANSAVLVYDCEIVDFVFLEVHQFSTNAINYNCEFEQKNSAVLKPDKSFISSYITTKIYRQPTDNYRSCS
jgi:hypothetical protein